MSKFFEETMQGLLEAVAIEKEEINVKRKADMPAPTYAASENLKINEKNSALTRKV